jgi:hypothetical protein
LFAWPLTTRPITSVSRGVSVASFSRIDRQGTLLLTQLAVLVQRLVYASDQILLAKRLLDEVECPGLHCVDSHGHVAMTGDEDDRNRCALPVQLLPATPGH